MASSSFLSRLSVTSVAGALALALCAGCGGALGAPGGGFNGDGGSAGAAGETGGAPSTGGAATGGLSGTGGTTYVDPDCPDVIPPPPVADCDPLKPYEVCSAGDACYPYLEYPYGEGCGYAIHGATCQPAGVGTQGDSCEYTQCSPGFLCVIGSGGGARCAKLCPLVGDDGCDPGFLCGEVDVPGYGVCS